MCQEKINEEALDFPPFLTLYLAVANGFEISADPRSPFALGYLDEAPNHESLNFGGDFAVVDLPQEHQCARHSLMIRGAEKQVAPAAQE